MSYCHRMSSVISFCCSLVVQLFRLSSFRSSFLPVGHLAGLDGFVGCIDLTYLRDSLTNVCIRVLSPGCPSLGRICRIAPTNFSRGGVHISLLCPSSTCVCMCALNAGGCVIDLLVQGWASTSSLLCLHDHRKQCKHR